MNLSTSSKLIQGLGMTLTASATITEKSHNAADNSSEIAWTLNASRSGGPFSGTVRKNAARIELWIAGNQEILIFPLDNSGTHTRSGTLTVHHDNDGTKSLNCSLIIHRGAGGETGFSPYQDPYCFGEASTTSTMNLTSIPMASGLSLSSLNVHPGDSLKLTAQAQDKSFLHSCYIRMDDSNMRASPDSGMKDSVTWTVPKDRAFIEKHFKGHSSASATATLYTYRKWTDSRSIGSASKSFRVTLPDSYKPSVKMTVTPVNPAGFPAGVFIQGYTKPKITLTPTFSAGASLSSAQINGDGTSYSGLSAEGEALSGSGTATFTGTVTDDRGMTGTVSQTVKVMEYTPPSIFATVTRCDKNKNPTDAGTCVHIEANVSFSSATGKHSVKAEYREAGTTAWKPVKDTPPCYILDGSFDTAKAYEFRFTSSDEVSSSVDVETLSPSMNLIHLSKDGTGFTLGGTQESPKTFLCNLSAVLDGAQVGSVSVQKGTYRFGMSFFAPGVYVIICTGPTASTVDLLTVSPMGAALYNEQTPLYKLYIANAPFGKMVYLDTTLPCTIIKLTAVEDGPAEICTPEALPKSGLTAVQPYTVPRTAFPGESSAFYARSGNIVTINLVKTYTASSTGWHTLVTLPDGLNVRPAISFDTMAANNKVTNDPIQCRVNSNGTVNFWAAKTGAYQIMLSMTFSV